MGYMKTGVIGQFEIFKAAIDQLESSVLITDSKGVIEYVNAFFTRKTGYLPDEVIGRNPKMIFHDMPSDPDNGNLWQTLRMGGTWHGEVQNKTKNGTIVWESVSVSPIRDDEDEITNFIVIYQDIEKQKVAELDLEQRERLLNDVEKVHRSGGWEYDIETGVSYWTDELYRLHAIDKDSDVNHIAQGLKCIHEEDRDLVERAFFNALKTGEGYDLVVRFEDLNGVKKWCRFKCKALIDDEGKFHKLVGTVIDVTERIEKEKQLEEANTRLEYALLGAQAGMWDWNVKTGEVIFDDRWAGMLGYTLEELSPLSLDTWTSLTHPEDLEMAMIELKKCFSGEKPIYECNMRMKHKKGHWVWVNDRGAVFERDNDGEAVRMVGTHIDITESVKQRQKLEESEKRYRTLFEKSSDANLLERDGIIVDCNEATVKILGYDLKEEVIGLKISDISPEIYKGKSAVDFIRKNQAIAIKKGHHRLEWEHIRKDGSVFPVEIMLTNLDDDEYRDMRYVVWRDLTKRKEAEAAVVKSNEERGLLLGEIHHRVKNNLAIISGLVQLQMFKSKKKHDFNLLSKTVNRISSIALIHEQLYQSDDFAGIPLHENISKQVEYIHSMYDNEDTIIHTNLDLDEVTVKIDLAIPVGLLINEVLNNAYKYAFKDMDEGTITIILEQKDGLIHLVLADNGVGMKQEDYYQDETLGSTLIENVLTQMQADVKIDMENGVRYDIVFGQN